MLLVREIKAVFTADKPELNWTELNSGGLSDSWSV